MIIGTILFFALVILFIFAFAIASADLILGDYKSSMLYFLGAIVISIAIGSVYIHQFEIAYNCNSYEEEIKYVKGVIENTVYFDDKSITLKETRISRPDELGEKYIGVKSMFDLKEGDVIRIRFLRGITHNTLVELELIDNIIDE